MRQFTRQLSALLYHLFVSAGIGSYIRINYEDGKFVPGMNMKSDIPPSPRYVTAVQKLWIDKVNKYCENENVDKEGIFFFMERTQGGVLLTSSFTKERTLMVDEDIAKLIPTMMVTT